MRVLVVEDDSSVSHWLGSKLHAYGHNCRLIDNGEGALQILKNEAFDVVILDRMLPRMDGIEVLNRLHGVARPPILILSANDQSSDRVEGLRAGADDYLGKPFDFTELLLRLELLARRHNQTAQEDCIQVEDMQIDLARREVTRAGRRIDLTDKEFKLLQVLAEHVGQTVTRGMLLEKVWGYHFDPQTNLIDVHLSKLRNKLDKGFERAMIRTVRAIGYVFG
ncbi:MULTISPECIES: response regulator transcription factor [Pseudomonas]|jgi:two-component system OmpR family response regulator|uniref:response regulator transcription factor n=1 Tax=Pseudomonas TaxID=286 RepID=UPI00132F1285|nr:MULTISPECIES: response regulator transcription factor [Pseudomonas]MCS3514923.1 two-component system OmpR family response regulator [Pseudomonas grimontii]QHF44366.1 DNA-binding response regulator [Pseudomonas sp. S35]